MMPPIAPRPFSQMARRDHRLYGNTLPGLRGTLTAWPYYHQQRRKPALWHNPDRGHWRRVERARSRRAEVAWALFDARMCAHCKCYAQGEEQRECIAAGRPLCEEERS